MSNRHALYQLIIIRGAAGQADRRITLDYQIQEYFVQIANQQFDYSLLQEVICRLQRKERKSGKTINKQLS